MGVPDLAGWHVGKQFTTGIVVAVGVSVCLAAAITPIANRPLPPTITVFTMLMTTALISTCITSVLLGAQARALRSYSQAVLAIGYGFTSATMVPYILFYPAVLGDLAQRLNVQTQSALTLFLLWHCSFIGSVIAYHLVGWNHPSGVPWRGGRVFLRRLRFGAFAGWFIFAGLALWYPRMPLLNTGNTITTLGRYVVGTVALLAFVPMLMPLRTRRFNRLLDVCLSTSCALITLDLYLILIAPTRYSLGWYASRFDIVALTATVLLMLIWQTGRMYGHLSASATRFKDEAYRDGLTGIPNRRAFDEELSRRFARAANETPTFALAMVDIDHFKAFNDAYGHLAGDACIAQVATALAAAIRRPKDFVARYGGEEFAVVIEDGRAAAGTLVSERLRTFVENSGIVTTEGVVTVSIGSAVASAGDDPARLVKRADGLLYLAKARGRNRVEFEDRSRDDVSFREPRG